MATCIHGTHWDGIGVFWCPQCATVASQSVAPFTFAVARSPDDKDIEIATLKGERAELRAHLARVKRLAGALCKAVNDDEAHEIDEATVRALVALRLAISPDGSVAALVGADSQPSPEPLRPRS